MSSAAPEPVLDDGAQGLGRPPASPIVTLPPEEVEETGIPISPSTGQPHRHPVMILADVFLYGASAVSAVALGFFWWRAIHMASFANSAHLIEMINPRPGSAASVFSVVGVMIMAVITVAAPAIAAFNAWNGHRWSRVAAIVATVLGCLAFFLHPLAWWAVPLAAVGAVILWLPPVGRYFANWRAFRTVERPVHSLYTDVTYGPLPRFR